MKSILFVVLLGLFSMAQAQTIRENPEKVRYMQKSVSQKKTGFILLGTGWAFFAAGGIKLLGELPEYFDDPDRSKKIRTPEILMITGGAALLSSIPFFMASKKNRQLSKSVTFSIDQQKYFKVGQYGLTNAYQPAFVMNIHF